MLRLEYTIRTRVTFLKNGKTSKREISKTLKTMAFLYLIKGTLLGTIVTHLPPPPPKKKKRSKTKNTWPRIGPGMQL